jgi:transposase-like protein
MKRKRFSEEEIAFALRQADAGSSVEEVCRKLGISEPTFYWWKKQFGYPRTSFRRLTMTIRRRLPYTSSSFSAFSRSSSRIARRNSSTSRP